MKYPNPITCIQDAAQLDGFEGHILAMVDETLNAPADEVNFPPAEWTVGDDEFSSSSSPAVASLHDGHAVNAASAAYFADAAGRTATEHMDKTDDFVSLLSDEDDSAVRGKTVLPSSAAAQPVQGAAACLAGSSSSGFASDEEDVPLAVRLARRAAVATGNADPVAGSSAASKPMSSIQQAPAAGRAGLLSGTTSSAASSSSSGPRINPRSAGSAAATASVSSLTMGPAAGRPPLPTTSKSISVSGGHGGGSAAGAAASTKSSSARPAPVAGNGDEEQHAMHWCCADCGRSYHRNADDSAWGVDVAGALGVSSGSSGGPGSVCPHASFPHTCGLDGENWQVILLLDNREVRTRDDRTYIQSQLLNNHVPCEVRQLPLGDFLWIARRKPGTARPANVPMHLRPPPPPSAAAGVEANDGAADDAGQPAVAKKKRKKKADADVEVDESAAVMVPPEPSPTDEYMLNFIVERKQVSDLAASITDGRYQEQKARLTSTGLRTTYLVEGEPSKVADNAAYGGRVGPKHILGAMVSTQIMYGMRVVNTYTLDSTVAFITSMHQSVEHQFRTGALCKACRDDGSLRPPMPQFEKELDIIAAAASSASLHGDGDLGFPMSQQLSQAIAGAEASSSSSVKGPRPLQQCPNDKCSLWGREGLPREVSSYNEWCTLAKKPKQMTTMQLLAMSLRQVAGVSADRAQAIIELYPTPSALFDAFASLRHPQHDGPLVLRNLSIPHQKNVLGPAIASTMYQVVYGTGGGSGAGTSGTAAAAGHNRVGAAGAADDSFDWDAAVDEMSRHTAASNRSGGAGGGGSKGGQASFGSFKPTAAAAGRGKVVGGGATRAGTGSRSNSITSAHGGGAGY